MNQENQKGIAVVTGASGGIGAAICRSLAECGFTVGIHFNRNEAAAKELSTQLSGGRTPTEESGNGHSTHRASCDIKTPFLIQGDLSTIDGCDQIYETLRKQELPLDVLVNNAGVVRDNPLFSATMEEYEDTLNLNLRGTWYITKRLVRLMIRKKQGRVINISSISGSIGNPTQSVYGMTKAAIDNFTKVAAAELAEHGIYVNSIAPGFIDTEMTDRLPDEHKQMILDRIPLKRMGKPEEIAEIVRFLSTANSYITGTVIHANGGLYAG